MFVSTAPFSDTSYMGSSYRSSSTSNNYNNYSSGSYRSAIGSNFSDYSSPGRARNNRTSSLARPVLVGPSNGYASASGYDSGSDRLYSKGDGSRYSSTLLRTTSTLKPSSGSYNVASAAYASSNGDRDRDSLFSSSLLSGDSSSLRRYNSQAELKGVSSKLYERRPERYESLNDRGDAYSFTTSSYANGTLSDGFSSGSERLSRINSGSSFNPASSGVARLASNYEQRLSSTLGSSASGSNISRSGTFSVANGPSSSAIDTSLSNGSILGGSGGSYARRPPVNSYSYDLGALNSSSSGLAPGGAAVSGSSRLSTVYSASSTNSARGSTPETDGYTPTRNDPILLKSSSYLSQQKQNNNGGSINAQSEYSSRGYGKGQGDSQRYMPSNEYKDVDILEKRLATSALMPGASSAVIYNNATSTALSKPSPLQAVHKIPVNRTSSSSIEDGLTTSCTVAAMRPSDVKDEFMNGNSNIPPPPPPPAPTFPVSQPAKKIVVKQEQQNGSADIEATISMPKPLKQQSQANNLGSNSRQNSSSSLVNLGSTSKKPESAAGSSSRVSSTSRIRSATRADSDNSDDEPSVDHLSLPATKRGLTGLKNLGNTCFMNSVIQCLSNTRPLHDYCLKSASYATDINNNTTSRMKGALMRAFSELLTDIWETRHESYVSPDSFKQQLSKFAPRFTGYSQQDAQEFLRYLLQGLHEDINRAKGRSQPCEEIDDRLADAQKATESWKRYLRIDDSRIVDVFVGQLKSELCCSQCDYVSVTFDPFWDLSLQIPATGYSASSLSRSNVTLYDCFDAFTKEEIMDGDERPTCEKCKTRRRCTKKFSVHKFPSILVLHFKRFSGERFRARLSTLVDFPLRGLDLSKYMASKNAATPPIYNLYAISNHSGTPTFGHYTAYCKHPMSGSWHLFDDTRVSSVSERSLVSSEAYLLFYELVQQ